MKSSIHVFVVSVLLTLSFCSCSKEQANKSRITGEWEYVNTQYILDGDIVVSEEQAVYLEGTSLIINESTITWIDTDNSAEVYPYSIIKGNILALDRDDGPWLIEKTPRNKLSIRDAYESIPAPIPESDIAPLEPVEICNGVQIYKGTDIDNTPFYYKSKKGWKQCYENGGYYYDESIDNWKRK